MKAAGVRLPVAGRFPALHGAKSGVRNAAVIFAPRHGKDRPAGNTFFLAITGRTGMSGRNATAGLWATGCASGLLRAGRGV
jgi:hypothetical protein